MKPLVTSLLLFYVYKHLPQKNTTKLKLENQLALRFHFHDFMCPFCLNFVNPYFTGEELIQLASNYNVKNTVCGVA